MPRHGRGYMRLQQTGSARSTGTVVLYDYELQSLGTDGCDDDQLHDTDESVDIRVRHNAVTGISTPVQGISTAPEPSEYSCAGRIGAYATCSSAKGRQLLAVCVSILFASSLQIAATTLNLNAEKWPIYQEKPVLLSAISPVLALNQIIAMLGALRYSTMVDSSAQMSSWWAHLLTPLVQTVVGSMVFSGIALLHHFHHTHWSVTFSQFLELAATCALTSSTIIIILDTAVHVSTRIWKKLGDSMPGSEFFLLPIVASLASFATSQLLPTAGVLFHNYLNQGVSSCVVVILLLMMPGLLWIMRKRVSVGERQGWLGAILPLLAWCCIGIALDSNLWMFSGQLNRLLTVLNGVVTHLLLIHYHIASVADLPNVPLPVDGARTGAATWPVLNKRVQSCSRCCCRPYMGEGASVTGARMTLLAFPPLLFIVLLGLRAVNNTITPFSFTYFSLVISHGLMLYIGHKINTKLVMKSRTAFSKAYSPAWVLPMVWLLYERLAILMIFTVIFLVDNVLQVQAAWTLAYIL